MNEGDTLSVVVGLIQGSGQLRNEVVLQISSDLIPTVAGGKYRVQDCIWLLICISPRLQHTHDASNTRPKYSKQDNRH